MAAATAVFVPSPSDIETYRRLRLRCRDLNQEIVKTVPKEALYEIGDAIGVLQDGKLVFETEDQTSVLMDCCFYDWIRDGKSIVQKYFDSHLPQPGTIDHELLQACLQAKYRILVPRSPVPGAGVYVRDVVSSEEAFLMDVGLSESVGDFALATRTMPLRQYWITTGAALPTTQKEIGSTLRRLARKRFFHQGAPADPKFLSLLCVRTLLERGAAERVRYGRIDGEPSQPHSRKETAALAPSVSDPSRNSPCPCGSGKRYKRCCGARK